MFGPGVCGDIARFSAGEVDINIRNRFPGTLSIFLYIA